MRVKCIVAGWRVEWRRWAARWCLEWARLESTEAMEKKRKREMGQERVSFIPFLDCPSSTCQLLLFCCLSLSSGRWAKKGDRRDQS